MVVPRFTLIPLRIIPSRIGEFLITGSRVPNVEVFSTSTATFSKVMLALPMFSRDCVVLGIGGLRIY